MGISGGGGAFPPCPPFPTPLGVIVNETLRRFEPLPLTVGTGALVLDHGKNIVQMQQFAPLAS